MLITMNQLAPTCDGLGSNYDSCICIAPPRPPNRPPPMPPAVLFTNMALGQWPNRESGDWPHVNLLSRSRVFVALSKHKID